MASKNIKGITIEIGGNTTKLESALKSVDKQVYGLNSDLKNLNQALKLDPKNTELLSQKYDVLQRNIAETEKRLQALKLAQKQMGDYSKLTDQQKSSYNALSLEIAKSEKSLMGMKSELKESSQIDLSALKSGLQAVGSVAATVLKKVLEITAAITGALAGLVAMGVKSYAEYEQQVGGIEAIFAGQQEKINKVLETGSNAWKDLTLSQTDYYKTFTSTYPLVKNSIDDENKAIDLTNRMLTLESDLANTFGYDISTASNAINWALKGSFNYIDNLNLGIKGTKEGFAEAAIEAGVMGKNINKSINDLTSEEILTVLETYAKKYGVMGRTANEAAKTIQGSAKSMKAAFDNFINGSGGVDELTESITNFLSNVVGAIQELAPKILEGIVQLLQTLIPQIASLLIELLPQLLDAVSNMIDTLLEMVSGDTTKLNETITTLITKAVEFLTTNIPKILDIVMTILPKMAEILPTQIPIIISALTKIILDMVNVIIEHLPDFISAAIDVMLALAEGLIDAIPQLLAALPTIIVNLVDALTKPENLLKLINAGIKLILALIKGIIESIPQLLKLAFELPKQMADKVIERATKTNWGEIGQNMVQGILDGFANIGDYLNRKVNAVKDKIESKFKSVFGIHSPSRLMRDEIGLQLTAGIGEGIEKGIPKAIEDANTAMMELNDGIQASVNPIINPTANSNPLYINIDKFYNRRDQDIEALAEELEYYRKNSSLAIGGQ